MITNQWDTYADLFNEGIGTGGDELHKTIIDPLIDSYIKSMNKPLLLDAGCGNGYLLRLLSSRIQKGVGLDNSLSLLAHAKRVISELSNISLVEGDLSKTLPFADSTFDVVVANMVLQYLPSLDTFANEAKRILKPGGIFIMIIDHPAHSLFLQAQALAGKPNDKFLDLASYFDEGERTKKSLWDRAILKYIHRTVSSYVNTFSHLFHLERMDEKSSDGEVPRILGIKWSKI